LYPESIQKYIVELFERKDEGVVVQMATIEQCEWKPDFNECHNNVNFWCSSNPEYKPVRGWLFYTLGYGVDFVFFQQHSVILTPDNKLIDITPAKAMDSYPFIIANESDEDFFAKDKYLENGNLVHVYK
jgi:hypothetical protein